MSFGDHSVFLMNDSTVKTVGRNGSGECGTGNTNDPQLSLYNIPNLNNVKQIACGYNHTVFLLNDGTVKTVGRNDYGQCGTGNKTTAQLTLYTIPDLTNVKQVACGMYHTTFLSYDGTVKTVGYNIHGQCGTGNTTSPQLSLYTIPGLNNVKQVACGSDYTVFLLNDGTVKTVGYNTSGQCGTGNTTLPQLALYTIPDLNNVKHVVCGGYHTVFLMNDDTVKTIGDNSKGQCGTGNTTSPQLSLYTIPGLNNVKQVACGEQHNIFLLNDGTVKTLGLNNYGQCGTGNTTSPQLSLYTIPGLNNVEQVACGGSHTVFLLNDNTVKTVGRNIYGQCGTGYANTNSPYAKLNIGLISSLNGTSLLFNTISKDIKYLILQNSKYYSINGAYYDTITKLYSALPISEEDINPNNIGLYGFGSINSLIQDTTMNEETFKPINKFNDNFELKRYKEI